MLQTLLLATSVLILTISLSAQDVEPNNAPSEAKPIGNVEIFRGSFQAGGDVDCFLLGNVVNRFLLLKITTRILTGPDAGTDRFEMHWFVEGREFFYGGLGQSIPVEGDRRIIQDRVTRHFREDTTGRVYLVLSSPNEGDYEVRIEASDPDREGPNISFRPYVRAQLQRELVRDRQEIRFIVRDLGPIKTVRVNSPGNRLLVIHPFADKSKWRTSFTIRYPLRRLREKETVTIRAEDFSGNERVRTATFWRY